VSRKPINPKLRFEIFCRDDFRCQYCGGRAPNVELQVDHVEAVASGGGNERTNLITSCRECNIGKGMAEVYAPEHFSIIAYSQELLDEAQCRFPGEVRSIDLYPLIKRYLELLAPAGVLHGVHNVLDTLGQSETYDDLLASQEEQVEMMMALRAHHEDNPQ
jgi:hypothetical protein